MAKGIQDLGIGLGYLYKTLPNGTTIVAVEKNTAEGVRSMKSQGDTNGPVIADRPAVGTITVNSVASIGSITAITIAGVNQIGANINVTSSTASVVATQIARAINNHTPGSGPDYTAQSIGDEVKVFSPANTGSTSNGLTITVSTTDPSINTTTTPLNNGSSQNSVYDTIFGYRFFIDADYGAEGTPGAGTASPTSLLYAAEITEYLTLRGLQSGIYTTSATIASDSITGITRCSAITQVLISNQGGAPTDVLAFIQTEGFAVGDELQLSSAAPGTQVPTLESAPVTTSPVGTPNIYLTSDSAFVMSSYTSITLQLRDVPSVGLAWVETGRSIVDGVVSITRAQVSGAASSGTLKAKTLYWITDLGDGGTFVFGANANQIESTGTMIRMVPKNYADTWRTDMVAPLMGTRVRYYQGVYNSLTGAVGTAPSGDTVNWVLVAKTDTNYYEQQSHAVGLNVTDSITSWPIVWERDGHNNLVSQSAASFSSLGANAYESFLWMERSSNSCAGNTVIDGLFDCANSMGSVIGNMVLSGAKYEGTNRLPSGSSVWQNFIAGGNTRVYNNFITQFAYNEVTASGLVYSNGGAGAYFYQFAGNKVQGVVTNLTSLSSGLKQLGYCVVDLGAEIKDSTFAGTAIVRYLKVGSGSSVRNCIFSAPLGAWNIQLCEVTGASVLTVIDSGAEFGNSKVHDSTCSFTLAGFDIFNLIASGSTITMTCDATSSGAIVKNSVLVFTGSFTGADISGISTSGTPTIALSGVINPLGSTLTGGLDLDDPSVFSAGVLTIGNDLQLCSTFVLTTTAVRNITEIVGLPTLFDVQFVNTSTDNVTFTTTAAATVAGDEIAGSAATFVIRAYVTGVAGSVWISKYFGLNTIVRANILI